ncbi:VCBS repeat-containing protein [Robiginitalea sp. M366]|uniref:VCBS repeat-containing protein n=1 Tax=Robiginitalea aestuariiviva TaxID=3036903 RepID=UPI00240D1143|nr:VCBS repeat-containing protein [Robiginitalea aestuariiviva]MDG1571812.1 VCBS repeat-containing protein [Robiginitalea aestuariiviva]
MRTLPVLLGILLLLQSCSEEQPRLRELDPEHTGITFGNFLEETPELNILNYLYYYNGAGVAAADFNSDGWIDLYFVANQQPDALYLNRGNMTFEEVTEKAGLLQPNGWTTGVTHVDINADGLLDLYLCQASGYRNLKGRNRLYVNLGPDANGIPRFEEQAAQYGLDLEALSTQAAFFDMDRDGDLDAFLMNHSVHPNRNYGRGKQREGFDALAGDRLLRNDGGVFTDISQEAGIYQGKAGYGLGLGISDLNADGYPDIYVGNDFFENDYLYLNNGNGTYSERIASGAEGIGHTTHFSMGNDIADLNNDARPDILSLDMLPEDLVTYKTSGLEYAYPIYKQYLNQGFAPQYMQNALQLNLGDGHFSEIGYLSDLAGTEWSWGTLLADFDNDGLRDIFISNGIKGATNDMDYMNFIANEDIQRRIDAGMKASDMPLTREIPEKKVPNYLFRNSGELTFSDMTGTWYPEEPTFSHGSVYADLDRDGDLDLVVNHMNQSASVFENTISGGHGLTLAFKGPEGNPFGIGTQALLYTQEGTQWAENYPTRGYLSAVPPELHFGTGSRTLADSLSVTWPDGRVQTLHGVATDTLLVMDYAQARPKPAGRMVLQPGNWLATDSLVPFRHRENPVLDFDREPLIVFAGSNKGPALATADLNGDGRQDLVIGGAKRQPTAVYFQREDGSFTQRDSLLFAEDALSEDTALLVFDANGDGQPDLIIAGGGNEFQEGEPLQPRLYLNRGGYFEKTSAHLPEISINASTLSARDLDADGDPDVLITADAVPGAFGQTPSHHVLINDGQGHFQLASPSPIPGLDRSGAITRVQWADFNGDGTTDLAVAGHWSPIRLFLGTGKGWVPAEETGLEFTHGWWNALRAADLDGDGDMDLIGGNWGLNSKFRASRETPVRLYRNDFDGNGSTEPVVTYYHNGVETPFASKDELSKQMPFLNKKFRTYRDFATASLEEVFGAEALKASDRKEVYLLESAIFRNDGTGRFTMEILPRMAQTSAIFDFGVGDFTGDGRVDLLAVGNNYDISTQLGRLDALHGLLLQATPEGGYHWDPGALPFIPGAARSIDSLHINGLKTWVIGRNNARPFTLTKNIPDDKRN